LSFNRWLVETALGSLIYFLLDRYYQFIYSID